MITIKLLAWWYVLSAFIYLGIYLFPPRVDFSRQGANMTFLLAQGLSGLIIAWLVL